MMIDDECDNLIFEGGDDELDRFETEEHDERREEEEDFWHTAATAAAAATDQTRKGLGAVLKLLEYSRANQATHTNHTNQPTWYSNAPTQVKTIL